MKKHLLTFIALAVLSLPILNAQNAKQYQKVGEEFLKNDKAIDAIDQFSKAIDVSPAYEKAYDSRAKAYESLGEFWKAGQDYEKLCIFDEKNESYFYDAARMNFINEEYPQALGRLDKVIDLKKDHEGALQLKVQTLIKLGRNEDALAASKEALRNKQSDINFYYYGLVNRVLESPDNAEEAFQSAIKKNKNYIEPRLALADLQQFRNKLPEAMATVNEVLGMDDKNIEAYRIRSMVSAKQLKYAEAITDISTILLLDPENKEMYMLRGKYYQGYAQHGNAISDFSKVISLDPVNADAYFNRAYSNEQILKFDEAIRDYKKLSEFAENDKHAKELMADAEKRLYELNRESVKPELKLVNPQETDNTSLKIPLGEKVIPIVGHVRDESMLKSVKVNNLTVPFTKKKDYYEFLTSVNLADNEEVLVEATDVYDNVTLIDYRILRTEVNAPKIRIIAPYASDNNIIYLDSNDPSIYVEGSIADESLIKSIHINDIVASYVPDDKNPLFQAMLNVNNQNKFVVRAEDIFGNVTEQEFTLNRESASLNADNPMGKTWVVFIENSNYSSFASLEGPTKDITLMKTALAKYSIHNFIHKKDMTKQEMERFFAIELRDLLRSNRVNSLLIWYAGHGKFVNETGYWVPSDARRDDEFTYFNINALKASMQSYPTQVSHNLIITDACESGPSFYQAMRADQSEKSCNDWAAVKLKSSQVFSSAGYELAVDNSQFTRTFANVLANNPNACIPIESVVQKVTVAVEKSNNQKPQFGKISGLEDENGTFFFIAK